MRGAQASRQIKALFVELTLLATVGCLPDAVEPPADATPASKPIPTDHLSLGRFGDSSPTEARATMQARLIPDAAAVERYVGCYRFELPPGFDLPSPMADGVLEAYLTRWPDETPATGLRVHLHPRPPMSSGWAIQAGVAVFSWSTGFEGVSVKLDKRGPDPSATAVRFSDNISLDRPPPSTELVSVEIPCSALSVRKLEIWAAGTNLEVRRASRSGRGSGERSSLAADLSRLQKKYGVSLESLDKIRSEGQRELWITNRLCSVGQPFDGNHPLLLEPEALPSQPPRPPHVCPRGQVWVVGVVTAQGTFRDLQVNSDSSFSLQAEQARSAAIRALADSVWLPALVCGRPVSARHTTAVDILAPCSSGEEEVGEALRVGGEVLPPKVLTHVAPDSRALRNVRAGSRRVVFVELVISKRGEVIRAQVRHPGSTDANADAAVIEAVKQWKFQPATRRGRPVTVVHTLTLPLAVD